MRYLSLLLFLTSIACAADVSGKWTGTLEAAGEDGRPVAIPAYMEFTQTGNAIQGAVSKDAEHRYAIEKGKIDGDQIAFEFTAPEGDEDSAFVHKVKLAMTGEGRLEGEMQFEAEGNKVVAKLKLTRTK